MIPAIAARPGLERALDDLFTRSPDVVGLTPLPCSADGSTGPVCAGQPAGTLIPAFSAQSCTIPYPTVVRDAEADFERKIGQHASWEVNGAADAGTDALPGASYVIELWAATGNVADLIYVSRDGKVIGTTDTCSGHAGFAGELIPPGQYLFGPEFRGRTSTPTPTP